VTFENIERFRPTLYFGVPTLYAALLVALEQKPRTLDSLRACVSAGEPLPADIFRRWKDRTGTVILDGIGSTECLHIFIGNRLDDHRPGTSGKPVPGYEVKDPRPGGQAGEQGRERRVWIRAESAAKYYWNKPEKTAETMVDGWLNTGDTYREDPDGYLVYEGRSDDMLKVGGIWCSPIEIESCLITHPAVLEAAQCRPARRRPADQAQGDRGAEAGGRRRAGLTEELMALCKTHARALQVPALGRVRDRAAQDRDRQDPALQIARLRDFGFYTQRLKQGVGDMTGKLFGSATIAALAFGLQPAFAQDSVKIGFVSTFTGPQAAIGEDMRRSVELAVEHLGGKMGGKKIEIVYEDDQFKPDVGKARSEKLVQQDKVNFVAGYIWSNVLLASLKTVTDEGDTILISANAGPVADRGELCNKNFFSTRGRTTRRRWRWASTSTRRA
jgi:hypothetical protein